ncbi:MAG: hypothetical protein L0Z50_13180 [Verrucomicrobiales bacterium]|nr:hypothetical protein [Verrucomicrobiales bacterium]
MITVVVALLLVAGCTPPKISQQRLVSQRNMTFSPSPVWNYPPRQVSQVETGLAFAGGGQGAGCTSCK